MADTAVSPNEAIGRESQTWINSMLNFGSITSFPLVLKILKFLKFFSVILKFPKNDSLSFLTSVNVENLKPLKYTIIVFTSSLQYADKMLIISL